MHNQAHCLCGRASHVGAARRGFTLLEMLAVVTLLGILVAVGMARYGFSTLGSAGARSEARRIALDLLQIQRRAISVGDNHFLGFNPSSGAATDYTLYHRTGSGNDVVEATREIPTGVVVTPSHAECEFNFEGQALAAYQITVASADQSWDVSVVPLTGSITVATTP